MEVMLDIGLQTENYKKPILSSVEKELDNFIV